jgi:prophage tail gpP-like protein
MIDDTLRLVVGGREWSGWQEIAVALSMDTLPANFSIQVTEKYPLTGDMPFNPGDPCQVKIGNDLVITGYLDRYGASVSPAEHTVRIEGRSKSEDLVDCSAFMGSPDAPSFQVLGGTAVGIIQSLARPYGVTINSIAGQGREIPQFNINFGETAWEIIDRLTRYSQLIAYDMPDGSIQLAQAGGGKMASGFKQGVNIEAAHITYSMDQRYAEYEAHILASTAFSDQAGLAATKAGGVVTDGGVPRFRRRYILSEQSQLGTFIAHDRAVWECNRRKGRSQAVNLVADSWRDAAGALWALNHQAPVDLPALKLSAPDWLIGSVTFLRGQNGQHAELTLMPKEAFLPEPVGNLGLVLLSDIDKNNPTKPDNPPYDPHSPTGAAGIKGLPGSPSGPSSAR